MLFRSGLASALEEKETRSPAETELMILAAQVSRKCWEIAGTWLEIERAEYRLANTFLKAGNFDQAFVHAQNCLQLIKDNNAGALEYFFAYEALALVEQARKNSVGFSQAVELAKEYFTKLSDNEKSWCEATLKKLV